MRSLFKSIAMLGLIGFIAVSSVGCASISEKFSDTKAGRLIGLVTDGVPNPVSNTRFTSIEASFGIALVGANAYIDLYEKNRCTKARPESMANLCARRSVVDKMRLAGTEARIELQKAKLFIVNNPTLDASELLDAAAEAVAVFRKVTNT